MLLLLLPIPVVSNRLVPVTVGVWLLLLFLLPQATIATTTTRSPRDFMVLHDFLIVIAEQNLIAKFVVE